MADTPATPGPWLIRFDDARDIKLEGGLLVRSSTDMLPVAVAIWRPSGAHAVNARAIAAVPELIDACRLALAAARGQRDDHPAKAALRGALEKAGVNHG